MSLERRKCISHSEDFSLLLPKEKEMYKPKYFSDYTMQGCVMECRASYSLETCGCLPYYYPKFKDGNYNGSLGCNVTQLECLANISGKIIIYSNRAILGRESFTRRFSTPFYSHIEKNYS